jgi:phosphopantothenoylcysteine decarboxylase/phosphopantothenate--cysteine ligase
MTQCSRQTPVVALLVGGGLAACEAPGIVARLAESGLRVQVVLSEAARQLLTPAAFRLAGAEVVANCQDLAARTPILLCPAGPHAKALLDQCADPGPVAALGEAIDPEVAVLASRWLVSPKPLAGRTVLLTAGPTVEDLDPVRFITNRSSGRMGIALATAAACLSARVLFIHGPLAARCPAMPELHPIPVRSARQMHAATMTRIAECDAAILCAAVADFTPRETAGQKIKKTGQDELQLALVRTPDILASLGALEPHPFLVGFAAETQDLDRYAQDKLRRKNCDMICANDVSAADSGFGVATNRITIHRRDATPIPLPLLGKDEAAERILLLVAETLER